MLFHSIQTPRDKIQCVLRCCNTIMNLLSMASNKSVPAADDLMPVLVYVLIKANPPHLLSTVQYVNTFYEKQLEGEEAYWWTQFASGVEFIKNMDYSQRGEEDVDQNWPVLVCLWSRAHQKCRLLLEWTHKSI